MSTTCPDCGQNFVALRCTWCRRGQVEVVELIGMLRADRERRRLEHEKRIARSAYWLGQRMVRYEVTKADALARVERLALAYWDDIDVAQHITPRGKEIGVAAFLRGVEGKHGRRAA